MTTNTGSIHRPIQAADTPTVDTARTAVVRAAVRADIEPKTAVWQFELRPWHYWTAILSAVITTAGATALVLLQVSGR